MSRHPGQPTDDERDAAAEAFDAPPPTFKVGLRPFMTPNFVVAVMAPRPRQDGLVQAPTWPLAEVDAEVLSSLCDDFRAEVFRKAGKTDPHAKGRRA